MKTQITRRKFFGAAALATATLSLTTIAQPKRRVRYASPNEKLNLGFIGAGGRATENIKEMTSENIVALCDVDDKNAAGTYAKFPNAKRYRDYRKMLEAEPSLDAVVVSTPDHIHAIAAISAMRAGKHVYCEKPLAHSIWEVRKMRDTAAETGVITQMGTQGHAFEGTRRAVEVIRSGAIGDVRELHVWTDRPAGWWPQGEERPKETPPVPETLDWDLWLGPAPARPYHPIYVPFKWRGRWDFGTGAIGDMGVHNLDTAFWALELGLPTHAHIIDAAQKTDDCPPLWSIIELLFPARRNQPAVKLRFYDGGKFPPTELFQGAKVESNGSLVIGSKGTLYTRSWHGGENASDMFMLLPQTQFADFKAPPQTLPRTKEHHYEFIQACKGGPATQSPFSYASVLTESLLVGQLALRTGKPIEWDAKNMKAKGLPEAERFIHPQFRKGWSV